MKNISILGLGWLGLPLAKAFLEKGYSVRGTVRDASKISFSHSKLQVFSLDIDVLDKVESLAFFQSEILVVSIPSKSIEGFSKLIDTLKDSLVKKIVFISSTSVYQNSFLEVDETSPLVDSPLVEIERMFIKACEKYNIQLSIVRFAGLYGYTRRPGNFFKDNQMIPFPKEPVNFIHQTDCIGLLLALVEKNLFGNIYNACSEDHPTREAFYRFHRQLESREEPVFLDSDSSFVQGKKVSSKKLIKDTGYTFVYSNLLGKFE
ncbi:MAG: dTDP-glucose 4,6-dehydratase [Flavobacteriaceae bacterium]|nr:MAG: dTDP-glucose 4,6-dehydratase [Flavobacteriaceae bacterium]